MSDILDTDGAVAQLGEHLLCKQGVNGSIPFSSTISDNRKEHNASNLLEVESRLRPGLNLEQKLKPPEGAIAVTR